MTKTASKARATTVPAVALTGAKYKQLKRDVQQLAVRADAMARHNKVRTLWRLGRRIARERVENRTPYHSSLLRDLSRDTNVSFAQPAVRHCVPARVPENPVPGSSFHPGSSFRATARACCR